MAHVVFISHAVEDKQTADEVCRALEDAGLGCWIAPRDIPPGRDYEESIVEAIAASRVLVLVLSSHSNSSQHVKREVQRAFAEGSPTRVIPFRIEPVSFSKSLSYYLASVQWIDASAPPSEEHLGRLVRQVRAELATPSAPPTADDAVAIAYTVPGTVAPAARPAPQSRAILWGAVAVAALLVAAVGYFVFSPRGPSRNRQANADVNPATPTPTATPGRATPTPSPTPTPTPRPNFTPRPLPTRVIIPTFNVNRPATRTPANVNRTP